MLAVSNYYYYPCVNNQVIFNRVQDWGQLSAAGGGDTTDTALFARRDNGSRQRKSPVLPPLPPDMYGHWYSPGNTFSFNYALCTNAPWGQNGLYFDDAASGNVAVGAPLPWRLVMRDPCTFCALPCRQRRRELLRRLVNQAKWGQLQHL